MPTILVLIAAGIVNPFSDTTWQDLLLRAGSASIGVALLATLLSCANYQEKVAQAQLLDTAFLSRWVDATATTDPCPECAKIKDRSSNDASSTD